MEPTSEDRNGLDGGRSVHYVAEQGSAYFRYQQIRGKASARISLRHVQPLISPDDRLLEFGCGGGELLALLSARAKVGVDVNETALADARAKGLEVYCGLEAVPADRHFDVALSHHSLEHVSFPIGALRALRERLRPGGRLILCVPIDDWRVQRRYDPSDINADFRGDK